MPITSGYANQPPLKVDAWLAPPGTATSLALVESTGSWPVGMTVEGLVGNFDINGVLVAPLLTIPFTIAGAVATAGITGAQATALEASVPFGDKVRWHVRGTIAETVTTIATGWMQWADHGQASALQTAYVVVGPPGPVGPGGGGLVEDPPGSGLYTFTETPVTPPPTVVTFVTTGATFAPVLGLVGGSTATASWSVGGTVVGTGLTPTINFGSAATRTVTLSVITGGTPTLSAVDFINLGFDHTQDAGQYNLGATYNHAGQSVTAVAGLTGCTALRAFMAANTPLAGALDFTGLSALEYVECFEANVASVTLTGCTSLIRLTLEACAITNLNLNPVAANLRDLRAAIQSGGTLTLTALTAPLASIYHFCVRDQTVVNFPTQAQLPVVEELLVWNTGLSGTLTPVSTAIRQVFVYENPLLTGINLSGLLQVGSSGLVWAQNCGLTSVNITGCDALGDINLNGNSLNQAGVDAVLTEVDSWATSGGTLDLRNNTGPSTDTHITALQGRGWTVYTDTVVPGGWADLFTRADATGIVAVGNGWASLIGGRDANIVSQNLVAVGAGYGLIANPAGGSLPANYTVTVTIPHSMTTATFWGIAARHVVGVGGIRLMWHDTGLPTLGNSTGPFDGGVSITIDSGYPGSWSVNQDHTVALSLVGTLAEIRIDGTLYGHATIDINTASTGTYVGFLGDGTHTYRDITVTV